MKKIALLALCLFSSLVTAMEAPILGWKFTNKTGEPVTLKWYKTRVDFLGITPWGTKKEIPNSSYYIENDESRFVVLPEEQEKWDGYSARRELLITYDQQRLDKEINANNKGIIKDEAARKAIVVKNKNTIDAVKAYPHGAKDKKTIFLVQPTGTSDIKLQGVLKFDEASERIGWLFENKADKPVYCGWYQAAWSNKLQIYANPTRLLGLDIITIAPSKEKRLPFPKKEDEKQQRQLLLSFDEGLLSKKVPTNEKGDLAVPNITVRNKHDLKPFNNQWQIFDEEGTPALVAHSYFIQVNNTTNKPLYASMYYVKGKNEEAKTFGTSRLRTLIMPQLSKKIQFPQDKVKGWIVNLLIADEANKDLLQKPSLTKDDLTRLSKKSFEKTNLVNWYMQGAYSILYDVTKPENNFLNVESIGGGGAVRMFRKAFDISNFNDSDIDKFEERFSKHDAAFEVNEAIKEVAVSKTNPIKTKLQPLTREEDFVAKRTEVARQAINKLFDDNNFIKQGDYVPKIALVFSGGGYRAMVNTIGYLRGAHNTGVLDTCLYMNGLSGSTWAINPLVVSGANPVEFAELQRDKVGLGSLYNLVSNVIQNPDYAELRFIQSRYGQFHGPVGLYGHAIANSLLDGFAIGGRKTHRITLSDMRKNLDPEKYPLPLSVAVDPGPERKEKDRVWYEFSPYYIGTFQENGAWVNSMLFGGSIFYDNLIKHYGLEYPLAQYMGIWGSAFALTADDIAKSTSIGGALASTVESLGSGLSTIYDLALWRKPSESACPGRPTAAQLPSPTYQSNLVPGRLKKYPTLCLIDGGITKEGESRHNFASVPALWRKADILIMCDSIAKPNTDIKSHHLLGADEEAHRLGLPFPNIKRSDIHEVTKEAMPKSISSLFIEDDKPAVIYMKAKKNEAYSKDFDPDVTKTKFTETTNFNYSPKEYDLLSGLTDHIISDKSTIENIKKAISEIVQRHKK